MKKQTVMLLGILMVSSFAEAQRVKHIIQPKGDCVLQDRTRCNKQEFTPTNLFERARLRSASFNGAKFIGENWNRGQYFDMRGADLKGTKFESAEFKFADFTGASLEGANFLKANIDGAHLTHVQGRRANFMEATLKDAQFSHSGFQSVNFSKAQITNLLAQEHDDFYDSNFESAVIKDTQFHDSDLKQADFKNAVIENSGFNGSSLEGANFRCAKLTNVDFTDAQFERIDITGAKLSGNTLSGATQKLLQGHFCGTEVSTGNYRSTPNPDCTIADGDAPAPNFCN